jgi:hypothetical protein
MAAPDVGGFAVEKEVMRRVIRMLVSLGFYHELFEKMFLEVNSHANLNDDWHHLLSVAFIHVVSRILNDSFVRRANSW